jgi:DNA-binding beta-propeller fold protein YncE
VSDEHVSEETAAAAPRGISARKAFGMLAVVLAAALIALLIYLLMYLGGEGYVELGTGEEIGGLEPILAIEGPGTGDRPEFDRPLGVAFDEDGRIWVADTGNHRVCVFEQDGDFLFEFGGRGVAKPTSGSDPVWEGGRFDFPSGIDVDEDGRAYVADFRNDQVQVFDDEGGFLFAFPDNTEPVGRGSSGVGGGIAVADVAVGGGLVAATDTYQILLFDGEGRLLGQFGKPGRGPSDLDHPNGVAVSEEGDVYVADSNHNRLSAFDRDGELFWTVGRIPEGISDTGEREFGLPRGVAMVDDGTILVADSFDFDLKRVSRDGEVLAVYGGRGTELGQFDFPNDVDSMDDLVLVADKENDRVQLLRFTE